MRLTVHRQGDGFPILCLHGHPGTGRSMGVFTDYLSQKFLTLAPDLRGYGDSRTSRDFEMADHLRDLEELLDQHHVSQCLVLGWSLGGILALELALRFPKRVSGLILVATAARPRSNHPAVTWRDNLYTGIGSILNRFSPGWRWNIDFFCRRSLYRYLLQQHTADAYHRLAHEGLPAYLKTSQAASRALSRALRQGYDRLSDLENIQVPCLMLCGEADRHITAQSSLETAHRLPNCQVQRYSNTAHLLPWEIPHQIIEDIDSWLNQYSEQVDSAASPGRVSDDV
ncbi:MAG: alpha/beta hydrolase [Leptolyngbyaceae cyanobacterium MO_188.B28]|nr:alpha/beta hydrolase [Leptolyngbyaceae cyanobacterium MO_188.B28]